ncbi:sugar ABC transporter permease [Salinibacterium sp. SYSU T00001]|uniref:carbohydrate ABC transporter permease n=1 Tax=Homoserinimonas sedimenticola TaxID=2986805 RepID=UPI0022360E40|nr:sugar ABC transporter permease [Salinibacterium sedimenticola]MCW4386381.1 sugar ABC transporter permease [Salinibacterium sedimenticola]
MADSSTLSRPAEHSPAAPPPAAPRTAEVPPSRRPSSRRRSAWAHRIFVSPSVLSLLVLGAFPLLFIIAAALSESSLGRPFQEWVGADNITRAIADTDVVASLVRSSVYAAGVTVVSVTLGVAVAVALHRTVGAGSVVRTLLLLPLITPPVVVGIVWKLIFNPSGGLLDTVTRFFGYSGPPLSLLSSTDWALPAIAIADVWEWTPLVTLLVFAALLGMDPEVREAAALDGAHGIRLFAHVTLPAIRGVIGAVFFIRLVIAFKAFDLIVLMTSGGPGQSTTTPSYLIYQAALQQFDVGRAAAITLLFALVVTLVTIPVAVITRRLQQ